VCPPFVHVPVVASALDGSALALGAQDLCEYAPGAYTGEVAAEMLVELGVRWVLVGHSERQLEAVLAVMNEGVVRQPDDQVEGMYETADGAYVAVSLPADHGLGDLRAWCLAQPAAALIAAVQARGGAAAQACNVVDSAAGPTFADLEAHVASEHPVTGRENLVAAPWRVNQRRAPVRKPAPLMAEGNTYVLRDILGRSDADIAALRERQIA